MDNKGRFIVISASIGLIIITLGIIFAFRGSILAFNQPEYRWSGVYPPGIFPVESPSTDVQFLALGLLVQILGAMFILVNLIAKVPYFLWKYILGAGIASFVSFSGIYYAVYKAIVYQDNAATLALTALITLIPPIICITTGIRIQGRGSQTTRKLIFEKESR